MTFKAPVVIFTYRKEHVLPEVFERVKQYNPPKLYIVNNAPANADDVVLVEKVRETISAFPFNRRPELFLADEHVNVRDIFNYGLEKVFAREDCAIILEDDTVPDPSFFEYCNRLLQQYQNDETIGCISGCNLNAVNKADTYFLSDFCLPCWGWATWANTWKHYRTDCSYWLEDREQMAKIIGTRDTYFVELMDRYSKRLISWDIQWNLTLWATGKKNIAPGVNLIANKGFGEKATYTNYTASDFSNLPTFPIHIEQLSISDDKNLDNAYYAQIKRLFLEISQRGG